jgi:hypothetical protein
MLPLAVTGRATWYLTRGTGAVTLVLLTLSVVLGIVITMRWSAPPRWPRFVLDALHRNVSLLVLVVLAIHVLTAVLDSFAPIRLIDVIVPFISSYRPLWIGFGALALDLLVAIAVTSVLRRRLGFRAWRSIHWLAYACWPIALLHGLGAGSDTNLSWMLVLSLACVAAVVLAAVWRITREPNVEQRVRALALGWTAAGLVALVVWVVQGPLAAGWARRAGTPTALLASATSRTQASSTSTGPALKVPFSAKLDGDIRQGSAQGGAVSVIDITTRMSGGAEGALTASISGTPLQNGGVSMTGSRVTLRPASGSTYSGRISGLQGSSFAASVSTSSGDALDLQVNLQIDPSTQAVTGTVQASPAQSGGGQ